MYILLSFYSLTNLQCLAATHFTFYNILRHPQQPYPTLTFLVTLFVLFSMLKNMEGMMNKEILESEMTTLYKRMKTMRSDFALKEQQLADYNKESDRIAEQHKVIKSEQTKAESATKKQKVVSTTKKSVFAGTPLDTKSASKASPTSTSVTSPQSSLEIDGDDSEN